MQRERDQSPYKNLSEYSNMHMQQQLGQSRVSPQGRGASGEPAAGRGAGAGASGAAGNAGGVITTTTGAYSIDYDAAYAARKQNRVDGYSYLEGLPGQRPNYHAESIGQAAADMQGRYDYPQQQ